MKAIVLAAGKGTRLRCHDSHCPKVLTTLLEKPLIKYVLEHIDFITPQDTYIVVGYEKHMVINAIEGPYQFAYQEIQMGTGHAVMVTEPYLKDYDGDILVLYGDMPLLSKKTYQEIASAHKSSKAECTLLTAVLDEPPAYGRIIRDIDGNIIDIVEKKDCNPEQIRINEVNVGVYVFNSRTLFKGLKQIDNQNSQSEYYLTDLPKILIKNGAKVNTCQVSNVDEIFGVNTVEDLKRCERIILNSLNQSTLP